MCPHAGDHDGVFQVNFYQDATATLDGVTFKIRGNYPVGNIVTVTVGDTSAKIRFRKPGWCPKLDVSQQGNVYMLTFDMAPRIELDEETIRLVRRSIDRMLAL